MYLQKKHFFLQPCYEQNQVRLLTNGSRQAGLQYGYEKYLNTHKVCYKGMYIVQG